MKRFLKNIFLLGLCFIPFALSPFVAIFLLVDVTATDNMMGELNHKIDYLASVKLPKIVFIGGSGCSHGIDSGMIEEEFGMPVVNMGLHAGMGLGYQLASIDPYIHSGDYVIITPEYGNFIKCLGARELLMVVSDVRPSERDKLDVSQWVNLAQYMPEYGLNKIKRLFMNLIKFSLKNHVQKVDKDYGRYKYDKRGDMIGSRNDARNLGFKPYGTSNLNGLMPVERNDCIARINKFILSHADSAVVVFPAALQDASFDNDRIYISAVAKLLDENGTPFCANPVRYRMHDSECWDTPYHLNALGIDRRTKLLIEDLKPIIKK